MHDGRVTHAALNTHLVASSSAGQPQVRWFAPPTHGRLPGCFPLGLLCPYVHDYSELRREAAVQHGALSVHYKTALCPSFAATGRQARFFLVMEWAAYHATCRRQRALLLSRCHKGKPRAAATSCSQPFACRRTCCAPACSCPHGEWCSYAHGVKELRLHAAVRWAPQLMSQLCKQQVGGITRPTLAPQLMSHAMPHARPSTMRHTTSRALQRQCWPPYADALQPPPLLQGQHPATHLPHPHVRRHARLGRLRPRQPLPLCAQRGGQAAASDDQGHAVRCVQGGWAGIGLHGLGGILGPAPLGGAKPALHCGSTPAR